MGILSRIRLDSPPLGRQRRLHMPTTSTDPRAAAAASAARVCPKTGMAFPHFLCKFCP